MSNVESPWSTNGITDNYLDNSIEIGLLRACVRPYYEEAHRSFHSWHHIDRMLSGFHTNEKVCYKVPVLSNAQTVAILFHDISYVPGSKTNEEDSITIFRLLRKKTPFIFQLLEAKEFQLVEEIIMSTKSPHTPRCKEAELVVDLDMLGFSFSRDYYVDNNRKIEAEFDFLEGFAKARMLFLKSMLERKPFYYTPSLKHLEEIAYNNIHADLTKPYSQ
jgi:predicted metal-dependent HD superfamily phosphohydrolase